jgi:hypothetical protein
VNLLLFRAGRLCREATVGKKAPGVISPDDLKEGYRAKRRITAVHADDGEDCAPVAGSDGKPSRKSGKEGRREAPDSPGNRR